MPSMSAANVLMRCRDSYPSSNSIDWIKINSARKISLEKKHKHLEKWLFDFLISFPEFSSALVFCAGPIVKIGVKTELSLSLWLDLQVLL
mgnify:CR=1 FL=1